MTEDASNSSLLAIELIVFLLFGLCLVHAVRIGRGRDNRYVASWGPLAAMAGTFVFTFVVEWLLGDPNPENAKSIYDYPPAGYLLQWGQISIGRVCIDLRRVPLWIPLGWAFVVYIAMRTSDKLEPDWRIRPIVDGLLALNIDLTLDPIAALNRWWSWHTERFNVFSGPELRATGERFGVDCIRDLEPQVLPPAAKKGGLFSADDVAADYEQSLTYQTPAPPDPETLDWVPAELVARECQPWVQPGYASYFDIPVRNFFAWFFIVAGFSFCYRALRRWWLLPRGHTGLGWQLLAALVALAPSFLIVQAYKAASGYLGQARSAHLEGAILFVLLWGPATVFIASRWLTYRSDHPFDRLLWLSPLALQAFFFFQLFIRKGHMVMPDLVIFIPTSAAVGFFLFGWPYLNDMRRLVRKHGWWWLFLPGAGRGRHLGPRGEEDR